MPGPHIKHMRGVAPGGGVSWQTVYSKDYSALDNQDLTTDGPATIGGTPHTVKNNAAASGLSIVNGTGLQLSCNSTNAAYYWGSDDSPVVRAKISDLWPSYNPLNHPLRLWARISHNVDANYEDCAIGFDNKLAASPNELLALMVRQHNGVGRWVMRFADQEAGGWEVDTSNPSDDVVVVELSPQGIVTFYSGIWSSGWPAPSSLRHRGQPRLLDNRFGPDIGFVFATTTGNSDGNLVATLKQLDLEALA